MESKGDTKGHVVAAKDGTVEPSTELQATQPLDEFLGRAQKAYISYLEAQKEVWKAYHETEQQVESEYKEAEQKAKSACDEAIEQALILRSKAEQETEQAYTKAMEQAQQALMGVKEEAKRTYEERLRQASATYRQTIEQARKVREQAIESVRKIIAEGTAFNHVRTPAQDEIFLQTIASAFKEELERPLSAEHFSAIQQAATESTNENIKTAKRMLGAQLRAADTRSKD